MLLESNKVSHMACWLAEQEVQEGWGLGGVGIVAAHFFLWVRLPNPATRGDPSPAQMHHGNFRSGSRLTRSNCKYNTTDLFIPGGEYSKQYSWHTRDELTDYSSVAFLSFPSSSLLLLLLLGGRVLLNVHRDGVLGDGVHGDGVHGDGSNDSLQQVPG